MARRRRGKRGKRTLSSTFRGWIKGIAYWAGAGAIMALFGLASQAVNLTLTLGQNTYDFSFIVSLIGIGLGAGLIFKGAREIGVSI